MITLTEEAVSSLCKDGKYNERSIIEFFKNGIHYIQDGTFKRFVNLHKLDLCGNLIEPLNEKTFEGLIHLVEIDLSDNRIEHVPANLFSSDKNIY
jgi:hypothetical protein